MLRGMSSSGVTKRLLSFDEVGHAVKHDRLADAGYQSSCRLAREGAHTPPAQLVTIVSAFARWHAEQFRTARIVQYEGVASGDFDVPDLAATTLALQSLAIDVARWYEPGIRRTPEAIGTAYGQLALRLVRA